MGGSVRARGLQRRRAFLGTTKKSVVVRWHCQNGREDRRRLTYLMKISQKPEVVPSILPQKVETSEPTLKPARDIQATSVSSIPSQCELLFGYPYQYPSYLWLWWLRRLRRILYRCLALLLCRNGGKGLTPKGSPRDLKDSRHRWP